MQYEIAELTLKLNMVNDYLTRRMADYARAERSQSCDFLVNVKYEKEIILPKGKLLVNGERFSAIRKENDELVLFRATTSGIVTVLLDFNGNSVDFTILDLGEDKRDLYETAMFYFLGDAFNHFALLKDKMVLHGSSIISGGKAVIFTAPSETGKSTHTGLWKKFYPDTILLNDDTPVVGKKNGEFFAWGSPWSGKTEINENRCAPLGAIVIINRGKTNKIERISETAALAYILGQARKIPVKEDMEKAMDMCFALSKSVPIYNLFCDISKNAVDTVKKELKI